jgi:hypothetical protein
VGHRCPEDLGGSLTLARWTLNTVKLKGRAVVRIRRIRPIRPINKFQLPAHAAKFTMPSLEPTTF